MNVHTAVRQDESTSEIAGRLGVSNAELVAANPEKPTTTYDGLRCFKSLAAGERLVIPARVAKHFSDEAPGRKPSAVRKVSTAPAPWAPAQAQEPTPWGSRAIKAMKPGGGRPPAPWEAPSGDLGLPYMTTAGCGPNEQEIFPGVCVPKSVGTTQDKPKANCPTGFVQIANGVCVPQGIPTPWSQGGGEVLPNVPCPPGFTQAAPGVCLPPGVPLGQNQGGCKDGEIEVVPGSGICVQSGLLGKSEAPPGWTPVTPEMCKKFGPTYVPWFDKSTNEWTCNTCREDEYMSADGWCMCKPGTVRKDPSDVNSICVPADGSDTPTGGVTGKPTVESCQKQYGPQSAPIWDDATKSWQCNVCGSNEIIDLSDSICMCKPGFHRQIKGDGTSPCVPDESTKVPEGYTKTGASNQHDCSSPNIWIEGQGCYAPPEPKKEDKPAQEKTEGLSTGAMVGIGVGVLAVLGLTVAALSKPSAAPAPALPPRGSNRNPDEYPDKGYATNPIGGYGISTPADVDCCSKLFKIAFGKAREAVNAEDGASDTGHHTVRVHEKKYEAAAKKAGFSTSRSSEGGFIIEVPFEGEREEQQATAIIWTLNGFGISSS